MEWHQPKPALEFNMIFLPTFKFIMLLADGTGHNSMVILNGISSTQTTFLYLAIAAAAALKQKEKINTIRLLYNPRVHK